MEGFGAENKSYFLFKTMGASTGFAVRFDGDGCADGLIIEECLSQNTVTAVSFAAR